MTQVAPFTVDKPHGLYAEAVSSVREKLTPGKIYDCFLYNGERELLAIRLRLLAQVVHKFVIVWSRRTFTGIAKSISPPMDTITALGLEDRVEDIELLELPGATPWDKESFSRNALTRAITPEPQDIILISDVDEIPRPAALESLDSKLADGLMVLALDYYNFKFNYQLVNGFQAVWAGPVACRAGKCASPQELREKRWQLLDTASTRIEDAGWHFTFLTSSDDVRDKLRSFSHQEPWIQERRSMSVMTMLAKREGFHDHLHPGSVWAVVSASSLRCEVLEELIRQFPSLSSSMPPDDETVIQRRVKHAVRRICNDERSKVLERFGWRELAKELARRVQRMTIRTARTGH